MRWLVAIFASVITALTLGATGAGAAQPWHTGTSCQQVSPTFTVCFEAWGVVTHQESGSYLSVTHRRFTEYRSGVLTFEQRDHSQHVVQLDASGAEHVSIYSFKGWSTPTGLVCTWRERLVRVNEEVVHSVDEGGCKPS